VSAVTSGPAYYRTIPALEHHPVGRGPCYPAFTWDLLLRIRSSEARHRGAGYLRCCGFRIFRYSLRGGASRQVLQPPGVRRARRRHIPSPTVAAPTGFCRPRGGLHVASISCADSGAAARMR